MKLNLGCGENHLEGYVNVDCDPALKPDQVWSFTEKFPLETEVCDEIIMYHVIEHVRKVYHESIFAEAHRVLRTNGIFIISFPEFWQCAQNWKENKKGLRDFWEATIYGRQTSQFDFHVTPMDRISVSSMLVDAGFEILYCGPEPVEDYNSVVKARKLKPYLYQDAMRETLKG